MKDFKHIPSMSDLDIENFWKNVSISDSSDCWEWSAGRIPKQYGEFHIDNHPFLAHRVAYFLSNNKQPGNMLVCHSCDNPPCCNPNHLFLGTYQDNHIDAVNKDRAVNNQGSRHGMSKLTESDILEIRLLKTMGHSNKYLSDKFGVDLSAISRIITRARWRHI